MRGTAPRKASPLTNAAGRGSGPHCPQAAGPRPRSRRFIFLWVGHARRGRPRARRLARHAAPLGPRRARAAARRRVDPRRARPRPHRRPPARPRALAGRDPRGVAVRAGWPTATWRTCSRPAADATRSRRRPRRPGSSRRCSSASGPPWASPRPRATTSPRRTCELLRYIAAALQAGFPLVAFLQLVRVYGQALARIADAEVRLFHLYVHEPLIRDGVPNLEMAEEMEGLARELLPLASPIMDHVHQRFLQHFLDQDVVGHMELEVDADGEARPRPPAGGDRLRRPRRLHAPDRGGGGGRGGRHHRALRRGRREHAARRRPRHQDDRRRGDDRRLRRGGAAGLGGRLPGAAERAPAAAHRHPPGADALPRRRLLRPRGQPGLARGRPRGGRRGAGHAAARRAGGSPPRVRAHRRGQAQGLLGVDRAVPRTRAEEAA